MIERRWASFPLPDTPKPALARKKSFQNFLQQLNLCHA